MRNDGLIVIFLVICHIGTEMGNHGARGATLMERKFSKDFKEITDDIVGSDYPLEKRWWALERAVKGFSSLWGWMKGFLDNGDYEDEELNLKLLTLGSNKIEQSGVGNLDEVGNTRGRKGTLGRPCALATPDEADDPPTAVPVTLDPQERNYTTTSAGTLFHETTLDHKEKKTPLSLHDVILAIQALAEKYHRQGSPLPSSKNNIGSAPLPLEKEGLNQTITDDRVQSNGPPSSAKGTNTVDIKTSRIPFNSYKENISIPSTYHLSTSTIVNGPEEANVISSSKPETDVFTGGPITTIEGATQPSFDLETNTQVKAKDIFANDEQNLNSSQGYTMDLISTSRNQRTAKAPKLSDHSEKGGERGERVNENRTTNISPESTTIGRNIEPTQALYTDISSDSTNDAITETTQLLTGDHTNISQEKYITETSQVSIILNESTLRDDIRETTQRSDYFNKPNIEKILPLIRESKIKAYESSRKPTQTSEDKIKAVSKVEKTTPPSDLLALNTNETTTKMDNGRTIVVLMDANETTPNREIKETIRPLLNKEMTKKIINESNPSFDTDKMEVNKTNRKPVQPLVNFSVGRQTTVVREIYIASINRTTPEKVLRKSTMVTISSLPERGMRETTEPTLTWMYDSKNINRTTEPFLYANKTTPKSLIKETRQSSVDIKEFVEDTTLPLVNVVKSEAYTVMSEPTKSSVDVIETTKNKAIIEGTLPSEKDIKTTTNKDIRKKVKLNEDLRNTTQSETTSKKTENLVYIERATENKGIRKTKGPLHNINEATMQTASELAVASKNTPKKAIKKAREETTTQLADVDRTAWYEYIHEPTTILVGIDKTNTIEPLRNLGQPLVDVTTTKPNKEVVEVMKPYVDVNNETSEKPISKTIQTSVDLVKTTTPEGIKKYTKASVSSHATTTSKVLRETTKRYEAISRTTSKKTDSKTSQARPNFIKKTTNKPIRRQTKPSLDAHKTKPNKVIRRVTKAEKGTDKTTTRNTIKRITKPFDIKESTENKTTSEKTRTSSFTGKIKGNNPRSEKPEPSLDFHETTTPEKALRETRESNMELKVASQSQDIMKTTQTSVGIANMKQNNAIRESTQTSVDISTNIPGKARRATTELYLTTPKQLINKEKQSLVQVNEYFGNGYTPGTLNQTIYLNKDKEDTTETYKVTRRKILPSENIEYSAINNETKRKSKPSEVEDTSNTISRITTLYASINKTSPKHTIRIITEPYFNTDEWTEYKSTNELAKSSIQTGKKKSNNLTSETTVPSMEVNRTIPLEIISGTTMLPLNSGKLETSKPIRETIQSSTDGNMTYPNKAFSKTTQLYIHLERYTRKKTTVETKESSSNDDRTESKSTSVNFFVNTPVNFTKRQKKANLKTKEVSRKKSIRKTTPSVENSDTREYETIKGGTQPYEGTSTFRPHTGVRKTTPLSMDNNEVSSEAKQSSLDNSMNRKTTNTYEVINKSTTKYGIRKKTIPNIDIEDSFIIKGISGTSNNLIDNGKTETKTLMGETTKPSISITKISPTKSSMETIKSTLQVQETSQREDIRETTKPSVYISSSGTDETMGQKTQSLIGNDTTRDSSQSSVEIGSTLNNKMTTEKSLSPEGKSTTGHDGAVTETIKPSMEDKNKQERARKVTTQPSMGTTRPEYNITGTTLHLTRITTQREGKKKQEKTQQSIGIGSTRSDLAITKTTLSSMNIANTSNSLPSTCTSLSESNITDAPRQGDICNTNEGKAGKRNAQQSVGTSTSIPDSGIPETTLPRFDESNTNKGKAGKRTAKQSVGTSASIPEPLVTQTTLTQIDNAITSNGKAGEKTVEPYVGTSSSIPEPEYTEVTLPKIDIPNTNEGKQRKSSAQPSVAVSTNRRKSPTRKTTQFSVDIGNKRKYETSRGRAQPSVVTSIARSDKTTQPSVDMGNKRIYETSSERNLPVGTRFTRQETTTIDTVQPSFDIGSKRKDESSKAQPSVDTNITRQDKITRKTTQPSVDIKNKRTYETSSERHDPSAGITMTRQTITTREAIQPSVTIGSKRKDEISRKSPKLSVRTSTTRPYTRTRGETYPSIDIGNKKEDWKSNGKAEPSVSTNMRQNPITEKLQVSMGISKNTPDTLIINTTEIYLLTDETTRKEYTSTRTQVDVENTRKKGASYTLQPAFYVHEDKKHTTTTYKAIIETTIWSENVDESTTNKGSRKESKPLHDHEMAPYQAIGKSRNPDKTTINYDIKKVRNPSLGTEESEKNKVTTETNPLTTIDKASQNKFSSKTTEMRQPPGNFNMTESKNSMWDILQASGHLDETTSEKTIEKTTQRNIATEASRKKTISKSMSNTKASINRRETSHPSVGTSTSRANTVMKQTTELYVDINETTPMKSFNEGVQSLGDVNKNGSNEDIVKTLQQSPYRNENMTESPSKEIRKTTRPSASVNESPTNKKTIKKSSPLPEAIKTTTNNINKIVKQSVGDVNKNTPSGSIDKTTLFQRYVNEAFKDTSTKFAYGSNSTPKSFISEKTNPLIDETRNTAVTENNQSSTYATSTLKAVIRKVSRPLLDIHNSSAHKDIRETTYPLVHVNRTTAPSRSSRDGLLSLVKSSTLNDYISETTESPVSFSKNINNTLKEIINLSADDNKTTPYKDRMDSSLLPMDLKNSTRDSAMWKTAQPTIGVSKVTQGKGIKATTQPTIYVNKVVRSKTTPGSPPSPMNTNKSTLNETISEITEPVDTHRTTLSNEMVEATKIFPVVSKTNPTTRAREAKKHALDSDKRTDAMVIMETTWTSSGVDKTTSNAIQSSLDIHKSDKIIRSMVLPSITVDKTTPTSSILDQTEPFPDFNEFIWEDDTLHTDDSTIDVNDQSLMDLLNWEVSEPILDFHPTTSGDSSESSKMHNKIKLSHIFQKPIGYKDERTPVKPSTETQSTESKLRITPTKTIPKSIEPPQTASKTTSDGETSAETTFSYKSDSDIGADSVKNTQVLLIKPTYPEKFLKSETSKILASISPNEPTKSSDFGTEVITIFEEISTTPVNPKKVQKKKWQYSKNKDEQAASTSFEKYPPKDNTTKVERIKGVGESITISFPRSPTPTVISPSAQSTFTETKNREEITTTPNLSFSNISNNIVLFKPKREKVATAFSSSPQSQLNSEKELSTVEWTPNIFTSVSSIRIGGTKEPFTISSLNAEDAGIQGWKPQEQSGSKQTNRPNTPGTDIFSISPGGSKKIVQVSSTLNDLGHKTDEGKTESNNIIIISTQHREPEGVSTKPMPVGGAQTPTKYSEFGTKFTEIMGKESSSPFEIPTKKYLKVSPSFKVQEVQPSSDLAGSSTSFSYSKTQTPLNTPPPAIQALSDKRQIKMTSLGLSTIFAQPDNSSLMIKKKATKIERQNITRNSEWTKNVSQISSISTSMPRKNTNINMKIPPLREIKQKKQTPPSSVVRLNSELEELITQPSLSGSTTQSAMRSRPSPSTQRNKNNEITTSGRGLSPPIDKMITIVFPTPAENLVEQLNRTEREPSTISSKQSYRKSTKNYTTLNVAQTPFGKVGEYDRITSKEEDTINGTDDSGQLVASDIRVDVPDETTPYSSTETELLRTSLYSKAMEFIAPSLITKTLKGKKVMSLSQIARTEIASSTSNADPKRNSELKKALLMYNETARTVISEKSKSSTTFTAKESQSFLDLKKKHSVLTMLPSEKALTEHRQADAETTEETSRSTEATNSETKLTTRMEEKSTSRHFNDKYSEELITLSSSNNYTQKQRQLEIKSTIIPFSIETISATTNTSSSTKHPVNHQNNSFVIKKGHLPKQKVLKPFNRFSITKPISTTPSTFTEERDMRISPPATTGYYKDVGSKVITFLRKILIPKWLPTNDTSGDQKGEAPLHSFQNDWQRNTTEARPDVRNISNIILVSHSTVSMDAASEITPSMEKTSVPWVLDSPRTSHRSNEATAQSIIPQKLIEKIPLTLTGGREETSPKARPGRNERRRKQPAVDYDQIATTVIPDEIRNVQDIEEIQAVNPQIPTTDDRVTEHPQPGFGTSEVSKLSSLSLNKTKEPPPVYFTENVEKDGKAEYLRYETNDTTTETISDDKTRNLSAILHLSYQKDDRITAYKQVVKQETTLPLVQDYNRKNYVKGEDLNLDYGKTTTSNLSKSLSSSMDTDLSYDIEATVSLTEGKLTENEGLVTSQPRITSGAFTSTVKSKQTPNGTRTKSTVSIEKAAQRTHKKKNRNLSNFLENTVNQTLFEGHHLKNSKEKLAEDLAWLNTTLSTGSATSTTASTSTKANIPNHPFSSSTVIDGKISPSPSVDSSAAALPVSEFSQKDAENGDDKTNEYWGKLLYVTKSHVFSISADGIKVIMSTSGTKIDKSARLTSLNAEKNIQTVTVPSAKWNVTSVSSSNMTLQVDGATTATVPLRHESILNNFTVLSSTTEKSSEGTGTTGVGGKGKEERRTVIYGGTGSMPRKSPRRLGNLTSLKRKVDAHNNFSTGLPSLSDEKMFKLANPIIRYLLQTSTSKPCRVDDEMDSLYPDYWSPYAALKDKEYSGNKSEHRSLKSNSSRGKQEFSRAKLPVTTGSPLEKLYAFGKSDETSIDSPFLMGIKKSYGINTTPSSKDKLEASTITKAITPMMPSSKLYVTKKNTNNSTIISRENETAFTEQKSITQVHILNEPDDYKRMPPLNKNTVKSSSGLLSASKKVIPTRLESTPIVELLSNNYQDPKEMSSTLHNESATRSASIESKTKTSKNQKGGVDIFIEPEGNVTAPTSVTEGLEENEGQGGLIGKQKEVISKRPDVTIAESSRYINPTKSIKLGGEPMLKLTSKGDKDPEKFQYKTDHVKDFREGSPNPTINNKFEKGETIYTLKEPQDITFGNTLYDIGQKENKRKRTLVGSSKEVISVQNNVQKLESTSPISGITYYVSNKSEERSSSKEPQEITFEPLSDEVGRNYNKRKRRPIGKSKDEIAGQIKVETPGNNSPISDTIDYYSKEVEQTSSTKESQEVTFKTSSIGVEGELNKEKKRLVGKNKEVTLGEPYRKDVLEPENTTQVSAIIDYNSKKGEESSSTKGTQEVRFEPSSNVVEKTDNKNKIKSVAISIKDVDGLPHGENQFQVERELHFQSTTTETLELETASSIKLLENEDDSSGDSRFKNKPHRTTVKVNLGRKPKKVKVPPGVFTFKKPEIVGVMTSPPSSESSSTYESKFLASTGTSNIFEEIHGGKRTTFDEFGPTTLVSTETTHYKTSLHNGTEVGEQGTKLSDFDPKRLSPPVQHDPERHYEVTDTPSSFEADTTIFLQPVEASQNTVLPTAVDGSGRQNVFLGDVDSSGKDISFALDRDRTGASEPNGDYIAGTEPAEDLVGEEVKSLQNAKRGPSGISILLGTAIPSRYEEHKFVHTVRKKFKHKLPAADVLWIPEDSVHRLKRPLNFNEKEDHQDLTDYHLEEDYLHYRVEDHSETLSDTNYDMQFDEPLMYPSEQQMENGDY